MPLGRWSRTNLTVLAAILWLGVGLLAPLIWSFSSEDNFGDTVEASTADTIAITQPIVLSTSPLIRVDRGSALFVDGSGKPLPPGSQAPANNGNIRLFNASISVGLGGTAEGIAAAQDAGTAPGIAPGTATADYVSPLATILGGQRFDTLTIRRSTIFVAHGETREAITDVKAEVSLKRRGQVAVKGEGTVRGQAVSLDVHAYPGQAEKRANGQIRSPFRFSVKGENIFAAFEGRMVATPGALGLEGPGELSLTSARRVARWFGAFWPSGSGLRDVSVRGQMELSRDALTFEKAMVRMDGNEGAGVLALRFGGARPVVSGTLAYKALDIAPYLSSISAEAPVDNLSWASVVGGPLTVPLGRHLDADLRLSADRVLVHKFDLGPTATTLALKDGRLLADITGITFNGSEGGGQIMADFNGPLPRVTIRGKLDGVDLAQWSSTVASSVQANPIQGKVSVVADVTGVGSRLQDAIEALSGKVAIRSQGAGRVMVDLPGLLAVAKHKETTGWQATAGGRNWMAYEHADLRLVVRDGALLTDTAEIRSAEGTWVATGVANILSDRIDMRLSHSPPAAVNAPASLAPATVLEFKGALREPRVRIDAAR